MVLKTLESPLDCKEIQPVHPKGDQSWAQQLGQQLVPEVQIDESRTAQLGLPRLPRGQGAHGLCERPEEHREVGLTPTAPAQPPRAHVQAQRGGEAGEHRGNWEKAWLGRLWLVLRG